MAANDGMRDSDAVDRVMNQVLAAEEEAREAVEKCRAQAARIVADAQEYVRRIGGRTEGRIKRIHRIADLAVDHASRELRVSASGRAPEAPEGEAAKRLERGVDALVDEILGGLP